MRLQGYVQINVRTCTCDIEAVASGFIEDRLELKELSLVGLRQGGGTE
jgi:hypothetical protein